MVRCHKPYSGEDCFALTLNENELAELTAKAKSSGMNAQEFIVETLTRAGPIVVEKRNTRAMP